MNRLKYCLFRVLVLFVLIYLLALLIAVVALITRDWQEVQAEDVYQEEFLELTNQLAIAEEEPKLDDNLVSTMRKPLMQTLHRPHIRSTGHVRDPWSPRIPNDAVGFNYSRGRRDVQYVLGVPTAVRQRGQNLLVATLNTLVAYMSAEERTKALIVVFIGETRRKGIRQIVDQITADFGEHMKSGLIDIVTADNQLYKNLELVLTNATSERIIWSRAKRNLDSIALMSYAQTRGHYYLQLADDILAKPDYLSYIRKFVVLHDAFQLPAQGPWLVCSFSSGLGSVGKLFATQCLTELIQFLHIFHKEQPNDWLLRYFVQMKVCPGISPKRLECKRNVRQAWLESMDTQFERNGNATLAAQKPRRDWQQHLRQPLALMRTHAMQIALTKYYDDDILNDWQPNKELYFWGYLPQLNGMFTHIFEHPNTRRQYRIYKGEGHMSANFGHAMLDILPPAQAAAMRANQTAAGQREGFIAACRFDKHSDDVAHAAFYALDNGADAGLWLRVMRDDCGRQMGTTIYLLISLYTCW